MQDLHHGALLSQCSVVRFMHPLLRQGHRRFVRATSSIAMSISDFLGVRSYCLNFGCVFELSFGTRLIGHLMGVVPINGTLTQRPMQLPPSVVADHLPGMRPKVRQSDMLQYDGHK